ncbi:MAG TPA: putative baseplate assembly protein, partial [Candidatus Dormibacteraeota bacterium]|nr:putative baseplate assembly protein [Candidatus Dormibacteraeota bacterium]
SGPGAPAEPVVPAGTRVQSVPGPGEEPQTFETTAAITARAGWNQLGARRIDPSRRAAAGDRTLWLAGTATGLARGDALLVAHADGADLRVVETVRPRPDLGATSVDLDAQVGPGLDGSDPGLEPGVYALRQRAALFGHNAPPWGSMSETFRADYVKFQDELFAAGKIVATQGVVRDWPDLDMSCFRGAAGDAEARAVYLDNRYPRILSGTWAALLPRGGKGRVFAVEDVSAMSVSGVTLAAQVTRLVLDADPGGGFGIRDTAVLAQSERLEEAWPDDSPVAETRISLAGAIADLAAGQALAVTGPAPGAPDSAVQADVVEIDRVDTSDPASTTVFLRHALTNKYDRARVRVNANVAPATHGETTTEVLGSGDSAQAFQRFRLRRSPLTYTPAPGGADSTLVVQVDGVTWHEVPSLLGQGPRDRVYVVRAAADGTVTVEFGDGLTGRRLPTGVENVTATYRVGSGLGGRVPAGSLTLLVTRPLGVRSVRNPRTAASGEDPQDAGAARAAAPLTVLTFDRVVSVSDAEDFAAAFRGIGKAAAAWVWDGFRRVVHVTVGAAGGGAPDPVEDVAALEAALLAGGDPRLHVVVQAYAARSFCLTAGLYRDPDHPWARVEADARAALTAAFSFDARAFAQPVAESEVMAVLQAVPGVLGVRLDALSLVPGDGLATWLPALPARYDRDGRRLLAAELLTLDPASTHVMEAK